MSLCGDDKRKFVRVYRAPPLINWGDPEAKLVWTVLREGLSTVHERREHEGQRKETQES